MAVEYEQQWHQWQASNGMCAGTHSGIPVSKKSLELVSFVRRPSVDDMAASQLDAPNKDGCPDGIQHGLQRSNLHINRLCRSIDFASGKAQA